MAKKKKVLQYQGYDYNSMAPRKVKRTFIKPRHRVQLFLLLFIGFLGFINHRTGLISQGIDEVINDNSDLDVGEVNINYLTGKKLSAGGFEIAQIEKEISDTISIYEDVLTSSADGVYLTIEFDYENISDTAQRFGRESFELINNGKTYSPTIDYLRGDFLNSDTINPGIKKTAKIAFDIPEDIANSKKTILKVESAKDSTN